MGEHFLILSQAAVNIPDDGRRRQDFIKIIYLGLSEPHQLFFLDPCRTNKKSLKLGPYGCSDYNDIIICLQF